jgi:hypothetical protein
LARRLTKAKPYFIRPLDFQNSLKPRWLPGGTSEQDGVVAKAGSDALATK